MIKCSIIIPVYNKASLTRQCLNTLLALPLSSIDFEIIIVDDASTDITQQLLAGYGGQIRIITHTTNTGFATACNDGAAAALGEYLIFLNNDTIPKLGWLDALVHYAGHHPNAAVVGSKLLFQNETIQHAGVVICQDRYPRHLYAGFPADHPAVNKSRRFQIVTAACALIRREPFERLNGFDPAFRNGYEDVDLCLRLGKQDYEVHYCHESVLYHMESISEGRFNDVEDNTKLYLSRWARLVQPDDLSYYVEDNLLNMSYTESYPMHLSVSPLLAAVNGHDREQQADRLLNSRSRQVFNLLKENIRLGVAIREAELRAAANSNNGNGTSPQGVTGLPAFAAAPRLLFEGEVHWLSTKSTSRLISVILPVKNGATLLRELLPRIFCQRTHDNIEIVAIDSGSVDDTVEILRQFSATVVSINPQSFNHGLTRNLAIKYARGQVFVFLTQSVLPADDYWLTNLVASLEHDRQIVGVCSRVLPRPDADLLTYKDGSRDPSASVERSIRAITDRADYDALSHHQLRLFINFHTVSTAIRPEALARIPFREVTTFGEDILWAKEVLEAGFKIMHEPSSVVLHSHSYSYLELLQRNVDDGVANREIVGRQLDMSEVIPTIMSLVRDDWYYLERECQLEDTELEHWRLVATLRRVSQIVGQWIGVNRHQMPGDLASLLSLTARIKAGTTGPAVSTRGI